MSRESKATKEEIQRNRDEAYQNGWSDGYAEGYGKAIAALPAQGVDALVDAAERLAAVLDRHSGKGPIPDVEIMFCWMAAQDVRAALAAYRGEAK